MTTRILKPVHSETKPLLRTEEALNHMTLRIRFTFRFSSGLAPETPGLSDSFPFTAVSLHTLKSSAAIPPESEMRITVTKTITSE